MLLLMLTLMLMLMLMLMPMPMVRIMSMPMLMLMLMPMLMLYCSTCRMPIPSLWFQFEEHCWRQDTNCRHGVCSCTHLRLETYILLTTHKCWLIDCNCGQRLRTFTADDYVWANTNRWHFESNWRKLRWQDQNCWHTACSCTHLLLMVIADSCGAPKIVADTVFVIAHDHFWRGRNAHNLYVISNSCCWPNKKFRRAACECWELLSP